MRSSSSRGAEPGTIKDDVLDGFSVWLGEALVGVSPLLAHLFAPQFFQPEPRALEAEICILAVVTSGLSLLAALPFGPKGRDAQVTRLTYFLYLITLASFVVSIMLFSFVFARTPQSTSVIALTSLVVALFGSLGLTLEREILTGIKASQNSS